MTGLTTRPWRLSGMRRLIPWVVLAACTGLVGGEAAAQHPPVEVDLGALDALGPPSATIPDERIRLHMPSHPASAAPQGKVQATAPRRAAAPAPTAATVPPVPQIPPPPAAPPKTTGKPTPARPAEATPPANAARPTGSPGEIAERIPFAPDDAQLPDAAKAGLDRLAQRLTTDGRLFVQLVAYAGGGGDPSQARRLSLSRALAARSYLVGQGVDIKQVEVRPLGNKSEPGLAPDRIDLIVAGR